MGFGHSGSYSSRFIAQFIATMRQSYNNKHARVQNDIDSSEVFCLVTIEIKRDFDFSLFSIMFSAMLTDTSQDR